MTIKGIILHGMESNQPKTVFTQIESLNLELSGKTDLVNYNNYTSEELYKYLKTLDIDILIAYYNEYLEYMVPLSELGIPIIMASEDTQKRFADGFYRKLVEIHKPDCIMIQNKCSIPAFNKYLGKDFKYLYFPWGADTSLFKDYGEKKIYDISISGKFASNMFRKELDGLLSSKTDIIYKRIRNNNPGVLLPYDEFAKELNRSKISLGGCLQKNPYYEGIYIGNSFKKNFEVPASKACLINTNWGDKELMGFKDGENFIEFNNRSSFLKKLEYYLEDENELKRVTDNGYKHVMENHSIDKVVSRCINDIRSLYE